MFHGKFAILWEGIIHTCKIPEIALIQTPFLVNENRQRIWHIWVWHIWEAHCLQEAMWASSHLSVFGFISINGQKHIIDLLLVLVGGYNLFYKSGWFMHEDCLIKIWIFKYFHISQGLHLSLHWHQVVTVQNKQNFVSIL